MQCVVFYIRFSKIYSRHLFDWKWSNRQRFGCSIVGGVRQFLTPSTPNSSKISHEALHFHTRSHLETANAIPLIIILVIIMLCLPAPAQIQFAQHFAINICGRACASLTRLVMTVRISFQLSEWMAVADDIDMWWKTPRHNIFFVIAQRHSGRQFNAGGRAIELRALALR